MATTRMYLILAILLVSALPVSGAPVFCCYLQFEFATSVDPPVTTLCSTTGCDYVYNNQQLMGFTVVEGCGNCSFAWPAEDTASGARAASEQHSQTIAAPSAEATCCLVSTTPILGNPPPDVSTQLGAGGCSPVSTCFQTPPSVATGGVCGFNAFAWNYTAPNCTAPVGLQTALDAGADTDDAVVREERPEVASIDAAIFSSDQEVCCFYMSIVQIQQNTSLVVRSRGGCQWDDLLAAYPLCLHEGFAVCNLIGFTLTDSETAICAPPAVDCSAHDGNCTSCAAYEQCSYCFADQSCRNATAAATCPAGQSVSYQGACISGPCVSPTDYTVDGFCMECGAQPNCGSCGTFGATCMYGNEVGPTYDSCPSTGWFYGQSQCAPVLCPTLNASCEGCSGHIQCTACAPPGAAAGNISCVSEMMTTCPVAGQVEYISQSACQIASTCGPLSCADCVTTKNCNWCGSSSSCIPSFLQYACVNGVSFMCSKSSNPGSNPMNILYILLGVGGGVTAFCCIAACVIFCRKRQPVPENTRLLPGPP